MRSFAVRILPLFYLNLHYALYAVLLTVGSALLAGIPVPGGPYLLLLAAVTMLFYTHAYRDPGAGPWSDPRAAWYAARRTVVDRVCAVACIAALVGSALVLGRIHGAHSNAWQQVLPVVVAVAGVALAYYGVFGIKALRAIGWLKPFVVAIVWASTVVLFPLLLTWAKGWAVPRSSAALMLQWLEMGCFLAALCVLFELKDYRADSLAGLRTWVLRSGVRATLYRVVLPLLLAGALAWWLLAEEPRALLWGLVPYAAALLVWRWCHARHGVAFHLVVVDGLLGLKALCMMTATLLVR